MEHKHGGPPHIKIQKGKFKRTLAWNTLYLDPVRTQHGQVNCCNVKVLEVTFKAHCDRLKIIMIQVPNIGLDFKH